MACRAPCSCLAICGWKFEAADRPRHERSIGSNLAGVLVVLTQFKRLCHPRAKRFSKQKVLIFPCSRISKKVYLAKSQDISLHLCQDCVHEVQDRLKVAVAHDCAIISKLPPTNKLPLEKVIWVNNAWLQREECMKLTLTPLGCKAVLGSHGFQGGQRDFYCHNLDSCNSGCGFKSQPARSLSSSGSLH